MKEILVPYTGQAYECTMCGACCHHHIVPLTKTDLERIGSTLDPESFAAYHESLGSIVLARGDEGGCTLLRGSRCGIHDTKPVICRLFPFAAYPEPRDAADGLAHEYLLPDGSLVYLYVNTACPGVREDARAPMPRWLLSLIQRIRIEMALTRFYYEITSSDR